MSFETVKIPVGMPDQIKDPEVLGIIMYVKRIACFLPEFAAIGA
jgi:hypothetical protein